MENYSNSQVARLICDKFELDFQKVLSEIDVMFNDDINQESLDNLIYAYETKIQENNCLKQREQEHNDSYIKKVKLICPNCDTTYNKLDFAKHEAYDCKFCFCPLDEIEEEIDGE